MNTRHVQYSPLNRHFKTSTWCHSKITRLPATLHFFMKKFWMTDVINRIKSLCLSTYRSSGLWLSIWSRPRSLKRFWRRRAARTGWCLYFSGNFYTRLAQNRWIFGGTRQIGNPWKILAQDENDDVLAGLDLDSLFVDVEDGVLGDSHGSWPFGCHVSIFFSTKLENHREITIP